MAVDTYNPSTLELREANHMFNADLGYIVGPVEGRGKERRGPKGTEGQGGVKLRERNVMQIVHGSTASKQ